MLWKRRRTLVVLCVVAVLSSCTRSAPDTAADVTDRRMVIEPTADGGSPATDGTAGGESLDPTGKDLGWPLRIDAAPLADNPVELGDAQEVRTGVLDNGLRYYVRSSAEPAEALSLRLVVNAGSLQQQEPESGLAHFVEHMLFNGTEAYPGNELDAVLQRLGAELGPDLNAYTSADETVYSLDLQDDDPELYDVAFGVLREWSSRALFDPDEVAAERGVVREETRSYYTSASAELDTTFDDSYDHGTAYLGRFPGGRGDAVMAITAEQAKRFYQRWYRPDNMAIVAVGDYPASELESTIRERFDDLPVPDGPLPTVPDPGSGWIDEAIVETITSPSYARTAVSIDWPVPSNPLVTVGDVERLVHEQLLVAVLDDRLTRLSQLPDSAIFDAYATSFSWNRDRSIIGLNAGTEDLLAATTLILSEFGGVAETGVSDEEFERVRATLVAALERSGERTPRNSELADSYVANFLVGTSTLDNSDFAEVAQDVLAAVTPADITEYWRYIASQTAPIVVLISEDDDHAVSQEAAVSAVAAASPRQQAATSTETKIDVLVDPPTAQEPIATAAIDSLDGPAHTWSYANGARVIFVESTIEPDSFVMTIQQQGGTSQFAADEVVLAQLAVAAAERSGLGGHSRASIDRFSRDAQVSAATITSAYSQGIGASGFASGFTEAAQILYAKMSVPEIDEVGLAAASRNLAEAVRFGALDPAARTANELARLRYGANHTWHTINEPDTTESITPDVLLEVYRQLFGGVDESTTVAIVGDLSVEEVQLVTDAYIADLPSRTPGRPIDREGKPIDDVRTSTITFGEPDTSGELVEYFSTTSDIGDEQLATAAVTADILDQRLFDTVREELSATYGGSVFVSPTAGAEMGFETTISFSGDPARVQEMRDRIVDEIADLAENGPSDDELQRARAISHADWAYLSNADLLEQAIREVRGEDALRWGDVGIGSVTSAKKQALLDDIAPEDIRRAASTLWPIDRRVEVLRTPETS